MDNLIIKDLVVMANHGLFPGEKELGQKFLVSLKAKYNMKSAALCENLKESVDYGVLCRKITKYLQENTFDLIETCAFKTLLEVFRECPVIFEAELSIKKPWAPIGLPLDYAEVSVHRKRHRYFLSLGSNLGNREENLKRALELLGNEAQIKKVSSLYETKPWGKTDQPDFINQAIEVVSYEEPEDFLKILLSIEKTLGRERHEKWAARTLDIDILFCDDEIIYTDELKIPHPYIHEREFVLNPMAEIAPFFVHPIYRKQIRELLSEIMET